MTKVCSNNLYELRSFHLQYCFTVAHYNSQFWYRICPYKGGTEQCGKLEWVMLLC